MRCDLVRYSRRGDFGVPSPLADGRLPSPRPLRLSSSSPKLITLKLLQVLCLRKAIRIKRLSELTTTTYDFMIWHECAYPTKNRQCLHTTPTHYTYIPRPISLCFYYYLKHLLSLFNSFIYIYKYRSRREGVEGKGGRREGERVKS